MNRMRQRRAAIAVHDSVARVRDAGVDVFFGDASFADDRTVTVDGQELRFRKAVIATGGRPTAPPVAGLDEAPYLTNETVFSLTELPRRLLVIAAGPIGCELAQAFARFGSSVTVLDQAPQVLPRESHAAAEIVKRRTRIRRRPRRMRKAGDLYRRQSLTLTLRGWLERYFNWTR